MLRLAVLYNVFDGEELLEGSVRAIRDQVEGVLLVSQRTSYRGEQYEGGAQECDKLVACGLADFHLAYEPRTAWSARDNETAKRQLAFCAARDLGFTHFLHMDCDEYYLPQQFASARAVVERERPNGTVCGIRTYFGLPTLQFEQYDSYFVPWVHRVGDLTRCGSAHYPFRVDPTRAVDCRDVMELPCELVTMHHFSWVRRDLSRKIRNTSSAHSLDYLLDLAQRAKSAVAGDFVSHWNMTLIRTGVSDFGEGTHCLVDLEEELVAQASGAGTTSGLS